MKYALAVAVAALTSVFALPADAATPAPRPTYKTKEVTVASPWIVVHYTRTGTDHPRFMKDDNHNGVPNYIEKLAAAGNKAWLWYAHNGFKGPLADSAGPDAKLDIYVKTLPAGVFGVTHPTTAKNGGSFMVIDNQLDMAHLAVHGSLQQTVAHELFHEFQLSYVPDGGIPRWAAEGSAIAMQTYVYPQVVDATTFSYLDTWLNQPWRSLYDESNGCAHCYGGALFWRFLFGLGNNVVSEFFGRLYGYESVHKPIGLGLKPLDEILRKRAKGTLYSTFGRFSYDIYRAGYKPATRYKLTAGPSIVTTPTRTVSGLSTHYIPIALPTTAKGIGVGVAAARGPSPEVKLVVGGPKGRVIEGVLRDKGKLQYFVPTFRNANERKHVMLIVTSGRQVGTAYKVAYQSL